MKPVPLAVVVSVMVLAGGSIAYACQPPPGNCQGSSCNGGLVWTSTSTPVPSLSYVGCSIAISTSTLLLLSATNLVPGAQCAFAAVLTNTGQYPVTLTESYSESSTCPFFLYSDNVYQLHPAPVVGASAGYGYKSTVGLSPSAGNSCEKSAATFTVQIVGAEAVPQLVPPVIAASPGTIYSGSASTLSTASSFSGGLSPYTCQWLEEAPGASSYSPLGSSFSCTAGSKPTASTGVLSTTGTWHFELQVTDSEPVSVVSNVVSVIVQPKVTTYSVTFSEDGLPAGLTWQVTVDGVTKSLTTNGCGTNSLTWTGLASGTYAYSVAGNPGWHQSTLPYIGSVVVSGASVTEPVLIYSQVTYTVTFTETGLPSGDSWSVTLGGVTTSSKGSTITFLAANGTYSYAVNTNPSCPRTPSTGTVTVNGAPVSVSVKIT